VILDAEVLWMCGMIALKDALLAIELLETDA